MTGHTLDELTKEVLATAAVEQDSHLQSKAEKSNAADAIERAHRFNQMNAFKHHHDNKARWSVFVMYLMGGMIFFQCILLSKVGAGFWNFTQYPWLLQALMVTNFAEIAALAMVIIKALHDHHKN